MTRYLLLLLLALPFHSFAQQQGNIVKMGDRAMNSFNFTRAISIYQRAVKREPTDMSARGKLAKAYLATNNYAKAEEVYRTLTAQPNAPLINYLYLGQCLRASGKYEAADSAYATFFADNPKDNRIGLLDNYSKIKNLLTDSAKYSIEPIAQNSPFIDFGAVPFGNTNVVFTSNRSAKTSVNRADAWTNAGFFDMYQIDGDENGNLYKVKKLAGKQPNGKYHEGPCTFSADGQEMIFTRTNYPKSKVIRAKDKTVKLQLFTAKWDSTKKRWTNIHPLPFGNNDYSYGHPSLSRDGKKLYFMSDMPGGQGETDIYVSTRSDGYWTAPVNAGPGVNTAGKEMFPFIAEDGTLYFSSDSRYGLGGLDIYSASMNAGEFSNAQNLGAPVNSVADDLSFSTSPASEGFFASNRPGGMGMDDVYKQRKTGITICGNVSDVLSGTPIADATVKLLLEDSTLVNTTTTNAKGEFCFNAPMNKELLIQAGSTTHNTASQKVNTKRNVNQNVMMQLQKRGEVTVVVTVFEIGKSYLDKAFVVLHDKTNSQKQVCTTAVNGKCYFEADINHFYEACASKPSGEEKGGYDQPCQPFFTLSTKPGDTVPVTLQLKYLTEGLTVKLEKIYYDLDKATLRPESFYELDNLVALMKQYPDMLIELSSHTDMRGRDRYNEELSAYRAISCLAYLTEHGIDKERVLAVGYGEKKPVVKCANANACTEEQHQNNRRTEFKILKMK